MTSTFRRAIRDTNDDNDADVDDLVRGVGDLSVRDDDEASLEAKLQKTRDTLADLLVQQRAITPGTREAETREIKKKQNATRDEQRRIVAQLEQLRGPGAPAVRQPALSEQERRRAAEAARQEAVRQEAERRRKAEVARPSAERIKELLRSDEADEKSERLRLGERIEVLRMAFKRVDDTRAGEELAHREMRRLKSAPVPDRDEIAGFEDRMVAEVAYLTEQAAAITALIASVDKELGEDMRKRSVAFQGRTDAERYALEAVHLRRGDFFNSIASQINRAREREYALRRVIAELQKRNKEESEAWQRAVTNRQREDTSAREQAAAKDRAVKAEAERQRERDDADERAAAEKQRLSDEEAKARQRTVDGAVVDIVSTPAASTSLLGSLFNRLVGTDRVTDAVKREEAAVDEATAAAKERADEQLAIDVVIPAAARFVTVTDDTRALAPDAFAHVVLGGREEHFIWEPVDTDGTKLDNTLRVFGNRAAVYAITEALVAPVFEAWSIQGVQNGLSTREQLHTRYWTDTVIPLLTQVAIGFVRAQEENEDVRERELKAAAETGKDTVQSDYNQTLASAVGEFKALAEFILVKALTAAEAGEISQASGNVEFPGSTQSGRRDRRARSAFDPLSYGGKSGVGTQAYGMHGTERTNDNQLLRYDKPFDLGAGHEEWAKNANDRTTFGIASSPILKMIFTDELPTVTEVAVQQQQQQQQGGVSEAEVAEARKEVAAAEDAYKKAGKVSKQNKTAAQRAVRQANIDAAREARDAASAKLNNLLARSGLIVRDRAATTATTRTTEKYVTPIASNNVPLFQVDDDGNIGDVEFERLAADVASGESKFLASRASFVQRAYGLPLLAALYLIEISADTRLKAKTFNLQMIGTPMPGKYFANLPILPMFFKGNEGIEITGTKGSAPTFTLHVPSIANSGAQYTVVEATDDLDLDAMVKEFREGRKLQVEASISELGLAATLHQLASLSDLYDRVLHPNTFAKRLELAHTIVGAAMFKPFTLQVPVDEGTPNADDNDDMPTESTTDSWFGRSGGRPRFVDPETKQTTFFQSASSAKETTVDTGLELRLPNRPRFLRKSLAKMILAYDGPRAREILQYKSWLTTKHLDGALGGEIDDNNEAPRTVLVPTDAALKAYVASGVGRGLLSAIAGNDREAAERALYDTLLFHVLQGEFDFSKLRNDRVPAEFPTELKTRDGRVLHLQMQVLNFSQSGGGGTLAINEGASRTSPVTQVSVSDAKFAKNGIWYIVDGVADPSVAISNARTDVAERLAPGQLPAPLFDVNNPSADLDDYDDDVVDVDEETVESSARGDRRRTGGGRESDSDSDDDERRRRRNYNRRVRHGDFRDSYYATDALLADLLGLNRQEIVIRNRRDFSPWYDYLYRTGTVAKIEAAKEPVHLYVPTPEALAESGIVLSAAPAALGEAHVAFGAVPGVDGGKTSVAAPITPHELHQIMQRDTVTRLDTLNKTKPVHHVPFGISMKKSAARPENELHHDDIDYRDPAHVFETAKGTKVHVHFIKRVLHSSLAASSGVVKSAAKPSSSGGSWSAAHESVVKALISAKTSDGYDQHVVNLQNKIGALGGKDAVLRQSSMDEIDAQFKTLRNAVARNQFVDAERKAATHTAISQLRAQFN